MERNYFDHVTDPFDIENDTGIIESVENHFEASSPSGVVTGTSFTPPYAYVADDPTTVPCAVSQGAGPHPM